MAQLVGQVALITGSGSGVGRAAAVALAREGAVVTLTGRTRSSLDATAALVRAIPGVPESHVAVEVCDVADAEQVQSAVDAVIARYGRLDILVNNAGINVPRRALAEMQRDDWRGIVDTNLNGAYWCVHAVLPHLRLQGGGTLIHIGSQAARRPSSLPGAAYTAAKAGLWGLSAVINAEERRHGIRSSVIVLGDTNTPLLDSRPRPPTEGARAGIIQPEDVAACILLIATLPPRAAIEELVLLPAR